MKPLFFDRRIIALGLLTLATQSLLAREFLIVTGSDELGLSIFFATWLLWIAFGAALSKIASLTSSKATTAFALLHPILGIAAIISTMFLKNITGIPPWEALSMTTIAVSSLCITSLFSLTTGILFVAYANTRVHNSHPASVSFSNESLGSLAAGLIVSILSVTASDSLTAILLCAALYYCVLIPQRTPKYILAALCIFGAVTAQMRQNEILKSIGHIPPQSALTSQQTPYRRLTLIEDRAQKTVFDGSRVLMHLPADDTHELFAALLMNIPERIPQNIALLGIGNEALIAALRDYPFKRLTLITPEREYQRFIERIDAELCAAIAQDTRIQTSSLHPARHLEKTSEQYDAIVIPAGTPGSLYANAILSKEFFASAKNRIAKNGMLVVVIEQEDALLTDAMRGFGASVIQAGRTAFDHVSLTAGKRQLLAFSDRAIPIDAAAIIERCSTNLPASAQIRPEQLTTLIEESRIAAVTEDYRRTRAEANSVDKPISLKYALNIELERSYGESVTLAKNIASSWHSHFKYLFLFVVSAIIIACATFARISGKVTSAVIQTSSGGLVFSAYMIALYAFQYRMGTLLWDLAIANALFMSGMALSSALLRKKIAPRNQVAFVAVTNLALLVIMMFVSASMHLPLDGTATAASFLMFLGVGVIGGIWYPCAELFLTSDTLEFFDHIGAAIFALITGIVMIPMLGIRGTIATLAIVMAFTVLCSALSAIRMRLNPRAWIYAVISAAVIIGGMRYVASAAVSTAQYTKIVHTNEPAAPIARKIQKGELTAHESMFYETTEQ